MSTMMCVARRALTFGLLCTLPLCATPASAQLKLTTGDIPQSAIEAPSVQTGNAARRAGDPRKAAKAGAPQKTAALAPVENEPAQQPAPAANFPHRLTQAEIKERFFNGAPIISRGRGSTAVFTLVFTPNGTIERTDAKGGKVNGHWKFLGDAYCSRWSGEKKDTCYTVVEDGEIIKVVFFTRAVATWSLAGTPPAP